jgi:hypothetical protein
LMPVYCTPPCRAAHRFQWTPINFLWRPPNFSIHEFFNYQKYWFYNTLHVSEFYMRAVNSLKAKDSYVYDEISSRILKLSAPFIMSELKRQFFHGPPEHVLGWYDLSHADHRLWVVDVSLKVLAHEILDFVIFYRIQNVYTGSRN